MFGRLKSSMWLCAELGIVEYRKAWEIQNRLVTARKAGTLDTDILLLLEHLPVFTLGRRGNRENLKLPESVLKEKGMPVIHVERGGDITYHCPGQIVGYPIVDLKHAGLGVADFVERLEEVMIRTAADWRIKASRNLKNRGAWVKNAKIGSIGIAIRHGISFHGFALNVNPLLEPFRWINPCGLSEIEITSIERESSQKIAIKEVQDSLKRHVEIVFDIRLKPIKLSDIALLL